MARKPASESSFGYKINIFHIGVQFNSSVIPANLRTFLSYKMKSSKVEEIPPHPGSAAHPRSSRGLCQQSSERGEAAVIHGSSSRRLVSTYPAFSCGAARLQLCQQLCRTGGEAGEEMGSTVLPAGQSQTLGKHRRVPEQTALSGQKFSKQRRNFPGKGNQYLGSSEEQRKLSTCMPAVPGQTLRQMGCPLMSPAVPCCPSCSK